MAETKKTTGAKRSPGFFARSLVVDFDVQKRHLKLKDSARKKKLSLVQQETDI